VSRWWGEFELELGACRYWRIGPLSLWVARLDREWHVAHRWSDDPFDSAYDLEHADVEIPAGLERTRYLFVESTRRLSLTARVADRPVVARPEQPVIIPAGESATLYVASPVWVELAVGGTRHSDDPGHAFAELPIWRMSSTWFGENTLEGTLCYATRSPANLSSEIRAALSTGAPARAHEPRPTRGPRVVTAVDLRNDCHVALRVQRLALPLPQMSIFSDTNGDLWTEATRVAHDLVLATPAHIESSPPREVGPTTLVSRPRQDRQQNVLARALAVAFGGLLP
jgi:hypothetical protein